MLRISRVKLRNFKSFRFADIPLASGVVCLAGPNGSGKCLRGDAKVQLADGSVREIGQLVEEQLARGTPTALDDGLMIMGGSHAVLSLNPETMKVEERSITAFIKRRGPPFLYRIKTRSGREVVATGYHPVMTVSDGRIRAVNADELREGTPIALPRKVRVSTRKFNPLMALAAIDLPLYVERSGQLREELRKRYAESGLSVRVLAKKIGIPTRALRNLFDGQGMRLFHAARALSYFGYSDEAQTALLDRVKDRGKTVRIPTRLDEKLARFLGLVVSEARVQKNGIAFYNNSQELKKDFARLVRELFDCSVMEYHDAGRTFQLVQSLAITSLLEHVFGLNAHAEKKIPPQVMSADMGVVAAFLSGLYDCGGYVSSPSHTKVSCEYDSASRELVHGIATLLLRFGVVAQISSGLKSNTKEKTRHRYFRVSVLGLENMRRFALGIPLLEKEKARRCRAFLSATHRAGTNANMVPGINGPVGCVGYSDRLLEGIKPSAMSVYHYEDRCFPSRAGLDAASDLVEEEAEGPLQEAPAESDIFWDSVELVEKVAGEEWVYDLAVEGTHNFLANDIFVHNSNICDGLRFAFGELSLKSLRAKKISDLIHSGASKAEITVFLDGEGKFEVKRAIRNDGKTLYKLNGKRATRTAVVEALRAKGLEIGEHNVIEQGQVQRIIEMNARERREVIDQVAGIREFDEKKAESLRELAKVEQKITEAGIVLAERKAVLESLEKEREQALRYIEAREELRRLKGSLIASELRRVEGEYTKVTEKYIELKEREEEVRKAAEELGRKLEELEERKAAIVREINEKGERERGGLGREIEELRTSIGIARGTLKEKEKAQERVRARLKSLEIEQKELEEKLAKILEERIGGEEELAKLDGELGRLEASASDSRKAMAALSKELDGLRERRSKAELELRKLELERESLQKEMERLQPQEARTPEKRAGELEAELRSISEELKDIDGELEQLFSKEKALNARIPEIEKKFLEARDRWSAAVERLRAGSGSPEQQAVNAVLELKQKGMLPGIHGTVAELCEYDDRLALAIEASAGPRLNYIVVDDIDTASKAIEYLKQRKLGRCTFIPLDKKPFILREEVRALSKRQGARGFLIDFVKFDSRHAPAFEYVFGDTLLVESIDAAKKLGIGKVRMVTPEGDLLEASGVITGGSLRRRTLARDRADEERLRKEADALKEERERVVQELYSLREEMARKRKERAELEVRSKSLEIELRHLRERDERERASRESAARMLDEVRKKLEAVESSVSRMNSEIKRLDVEIEKNEGALERLQSQSVGSEGRAGTEEEIERLRKARDELLLKDKQREALQEVLEQRLRENGDERAGLLRDADELRREFITTQEELAKNERLLTERVERLKAVGGALEKLYLERAELESQIEQLAKERGKQAHGFDRWMKQLGELEVTKATLETRLADLKAEFVSYEGVELVEGTKEELEPKIKELELLMASLGDVNLKAPEAYEQMSREVAEIKEKTERLAEEKDAIVRMIEEIEGRKKDIFMETFHRLNEKFKMLASHVFKGECTFVLENPASPFEGGLNIRLKGERKEERLLEAMSGGEKTLLSILFIFAIQMVRPSPVYLLDEADAALDKENSKKFGSLLRELAKNTQFLVVTHNDAVLSSADVALGVVLTEDGSKVVSVRLEGKEAQTLPAKA